MSKTGIGPDLAGAAAGRKLIAIVYADMVGYSQLIGWDDAGTLARLRALRSDLIDPAIGEHGGRIVQTGGDSLLMVFDSIDGAVRCAVKVQEQIPIHDRGAPADRAIRFRVGINIGDTIADGTDLHGDAVNVTVRLQEECPPGAICVSRAVRDHGHDRLHLAFEALGPLKLKNITRPVEAFVLRSAATPTESPMSGVGSVADRQQSSPQMTPVVAVLPFANFSQDPRWNRLCDGLVEDIITGLTRHRDLLVISRHSSFEYKGQSIDIRKIGHALGARYVLEGSVQAESGWLKVTAQLISSVSGAHIWAGSYRRPEAEFFAIQDEIVEQVVAALAGFGGAILRAELMGARRKPPASLHAYELYLLGYEQEARLDRDGTLQSIDLLKAALTADPHLSRTWTVLGWAYANLVNNGWTDDVEGTREMQRKAVVMALKLDPDDSLALVGLALLQIRERNLIGACETVQRALMAGASHADTLAFIAQYVATLLDRPGDAVALMDRSFVLNSTRARLVLYPTHPSRLLCATFRLSA